MAVIARIYKIDKTDLVCYSLDGKEHFFPVFLLGQFTKGEQRAVVGDKVELISLGEGKGHQVKKILPRENILYRYIVREREKKIFAANVDLLILVASLERPLLKQGLLDRYLLRACLWQIPVVIVYTKYDLFEKERGQKEREERRIEEKNIEKMPDIAFLKRRFSPLCVDQFVLSSESSWAKTTSREEFLRLKALLSTKVGIVLGQSGVGKSTLITALSGEKIQVKSQKLGKVGKGVHTTSVSEIFTLEDWFLIDSPGIRSFSLEDLSLADLPHGFPDLAPFFLKCQFPNCSHDIKSKGCFLKEGGWNPTAEQKSRFLSYLQIREEISLASCWETKNKYV